MQTVVCMYIHTKACRVGFLRRRLHALIYTYSVFTLVALNRLYYETIIYIKKIYAYAHQNFLHFIERIFSRLPHSFLRYQNLARIWQYMRERWCLLIKAASNSKIKRNDQHFFPNALTSNTDKFKCVRYLITLRSTASHYKNHSTRKAIFTNSQCYHNRFSFNFSINEYNNIDSQYQHHSIFPLHSQNHA